jgi:hypothetical protein
MIFLFLFLHLSFLFRYASGFYFSVLNSVIFDEFFLFSGFLLDASSMVVFLFDESIFISQYCITFQICKFV